MERSSEKNSELRSKLNCEDVSGGVKGRDERKERALDPPAHADALLCLDTGQRRHTWGMRPASVINWTHFVTAVGMPTQEAEVPFASTKDSETELA